MSLRRGILMLAALTTLAAGGSAHADEGMWTFSNLPTKLLKDKYGFEPSEAWIAQLRSAAVRFNSGGSGSFVSPDGLVMTNHHVGADTLHKISTEAKDYYRDGFYAKSRDQEVKAPDLELRVLVGTEDVTKRVNAEVKAGMDDAAAEAARRKARLQVEKESLDKTGLQSDVVTLYQGGQYHLYTYKLYTDVRLVFAPEFAAAFFGGDPDNFQYPRYDLDVCFFRAYEDGKPAEVKHYLRWSPDGSKVDELVFVAGHPGRTDRLNTVAHLEFLRDFGFPLQLDFIREREKFLLDYARKGSEQARQSKEDLFGIQNTRKARLGGLGGLNDEEFMRRKSATEKTLRDRIASDPDRQQKYGDAWEKIAEAKKAEKALALPYSALERGLAFDSTLFRIARVLVRLAEEGTKPNADRLREYSDSARRSLLLALFSPAPIYPEYETAKLAHSLAYARSKMPDDPSLGRVLKGRSPEEVAKELVGGTKLADVAERKRLVEGGKEAIEASDDPMIKLALAIDDEARAVRKKREDLIEGVEASNYEKIARALFEEHGDSIYPDATFTLRLAFGTVKGYAQEGQEVPPFTTIGGAFEHAKAHGNRPPYQLPESWDEAKAEGRVKLDTPLNFVSTADIIGGNSGSPVVNRRNEIVGLIFDGNIQSLVLDFGYSDSQARAVAVDSRGIMEALRSIYRAEALVRELQPRDH